MRSWKLALTGETIRTKRGREGLSLISSCYLGNERVRERLWHSLVGIAIQKALSLDGTFAIA